MYCYWNERCQREAQAAEVPLTRKQMTLPAIHCCLKEMTSRLQQFRSIVHLVPHVMEKLITLFRDKPQHPLSGQREMVR